MSSLTEAEISSMARVKWWGRRMRLVVVLSVEVSVTGGEDGDVCECNDGDSIDGIGIIGGGDFFGRESSGEDAGGDCGEEDVLAAAMADGELEAELADS